MSKESVGEVQEGEEGPKMGLYCQKDKTFYDLSLVFAACAKDPVLLSQVRQLSSEFGFNLLDFL